MPEFKQKSVVLLQGVFDPVALNKLKLPSSASVILLEGAPHFEAAQNNSAVLLKRGIKPLLISDNMAGLFFYKGWVKSVCLACQCADETGALTDAGGLILAVLAKKHGVPVKLLMAKHKQHFLGDPASVAPKGVHGYVPMVEWISAKYL